MRWRWKGRGEPHPDPMPDTRTEQVAHVADEVERIAQSQKTEAAELMTLVAKLRSSHG